MKHKVAELEGALLDAAVAKADGEEARIESTGRCAILHVDLEHGDGAPFWTSFEPSTDWRDGGPLIESERICVCWNSDGVWIAAVGHDPWKRMKDTYDGETALIAAMRAYVASKFGEEVELP